MRLLLDEMYPPSIAEQLRLRGHDAVATAGRPELRALSDLELFAVAQQEQRATATENIADFVPIADVYDQRGQLHHGLVLVDPHKYPRGDQSTIGRMVIALDKLLRANPGDEPISLRHFL